MPLATMAEVAVDRPPQAGPGAMAPELRAEPVKVRGVMVAYLAVVQGLQTATLALPLAVVVVVERKAHLAVKVSGLPVE